MRRLNWVVLFVVVMTASYAGAGEFNTKISVGDACPNFTNLPATDDKSYSLADFKNKELLLIVFTCNHCPVALDYEDRIIAFAKKYAEKVGVVAISVSKEEDDLLPEMKKRARDKGFPYPYLRDDSQKIGRALGAYVTPQFFLLNKERKVVYMGLMDDEQNPKKVKEHYLADAVDAVLKGGKPAKAETQPFGCTIEYAKVSLKAVPFADVEAAVKALQGKVVVIDFWATWCLPCKKEFPGLVELHRKYAADGVACMSVSIDDAEDQAAALKFLKSKDATFANFLVVEEDSKWKKKWAIGGVPVVFVYGRDGKLAKRFENTDPDKPFTYDVDVSKFVKDLLDKQ
jgi:thiol-disulfide isomerase/thioredoxin